VSARTTAAVRAAAAELGYRPNAIARSLKTGAARAVCLAVPDITNPFFGPILRGAGRAAAEAGYAVALVDSEDTDTWEHATVQTLRGAGTVDGFLLFSGRPPVREKDVGEPIVLVECEVRGFSSVRLDGQGGAAAAVEHLLALGHRRIGHLAAASTWKQLFQLRDRGRREALGAVGLDPDAQPVEHTAFPLAAAHAAGRRLLDRPDRPTAVICDDDRLAAGLYLAARERGLRIPEDLSVVGFDDLELALVLEPALTSLRVDAEHLGATAFGLLAERIADPAARARRLVQPVTFVERASTAPPAR
jgi:DNA-binding LacI/PurR family transcriptional regulator